MYKVGGRNSIEFVWKTIFSKWNMGGGEYKFRILFEKKSRVN